MKVSQVIASTGEILKKREYVKGEHNKLYNAQVEYFKMDKKSSQINYNPDGPSIICFNGTEYYTNENGDIHKEDGPAVIRKKRYKKNGEYYFKVIGFDFYLNGERYNESNFPNNLFMVYCRMKLSYDRGELQKIYDFDKNCDPFNFD